MLCESFVNTVVMLCKYLLFYFCDFFFVIIIYMSVFTEVPLTYALEPFGSLSLVQLVISHTQSCSSPVDPEVMKMIDALLDSDPEHFGKIENILNEITKDNKIDAHDIPNLILLLKELYLFAHHHPKIVFNAGVCGELLKLFASLLLSYTNRNNLIQTTILSIIDSCVQLFLFAF